MPAPNKLRVYLDNCCFNRPFDDQQQLRIRLETEAKLAIQQYVLDKKLELAWSYMLDFENTANPFELRRIHIESWCRHAIVNIVENPVIIEQAEALARLGLRNKDALHVACAMAMRCDYFLTTDDRILHKAGSINAIAVSDPINFIKVLLYND
ncbi:MAG: PIN domain-containing protein [Candidatus Competibacteraceae bacterium]|nr:MAG: PIN domain-containing protein [Candidatus Competibacteraceae bacterium]